ncbi:MAG: gliding motility-associated C-terminal domain-containing protein, partial [Bacteroidales bacterium]|nr:gliding motility-associated C-terminal domain-containing protein [Bacteroidales bacterium]
MKYSLNGTIWQSSVTFTNLVSGNYIIYVRDNLVDPSCVSNDSYVINTVPSAPSNPIANLTHPTCIILTGSIEITNPLGLNIEYSLDGLTWQSSPLFENLSIGNHTVFVRDNAVDPTCVSNSNFAINNIPDSPTAIISDSHDVTISGNCDGDATVLASGGDGNYTYLWDDSSAQATQTATGLCSGNYTVIVTDGNGCTTSVSITINEPNALVLVLTSNIVTCYAGCDGSTTATVSGGVLPYTYEWGDPLSQNTETAINLCYGMVGITVYDDNGASATGSILVDQNSEIIATTTVISNVSCNGDNDGVASVTAIGGTGLYTYQWDDLALTPTQTVSGLLAGTYNVIIYDANMCVGNAAVVITEPPLFTASAIAEDIMCNGDVTTVSVSGQGGTLSYTGTGTFIVPAGSYNYTITDANACVANTTIVVTEPDSLIVTENISNALCYGLTGSANISVVSGGTGTYSIIWQDSSTNFTNSNILPNTNYGYTVTDANLCTIQGIVSVNQPAEIQTSLSAIDVSCYGNCDGSAAISSITGGSAPYSYIWSNMETTISIVNLCAEVYHLTLTDSNACQAYSSITIEEPDQIQMSISVSDAQCGGIGGTAYATVSGGSGLYNFSWSDTQTGNPVSGLEPGSYIGYVTDTNACTASKNFDIDVSGNIDVEITEIIGIACYGDSNGTLQATSPNGVLPLNYYWDIPANTQIVSDLLAGAYTVSITDGWGCEGYSSYTLVNPVNMVITTDISDVRCYGEANGRITILTINGTPPYTYIWNNEVTDNTITDLAAGTYQVHIIDFNGCEIDESVTVNQPEEILLDYTISNITCSGYQDGAVLLTATGGTIPYNFSINNGINYLAGNSFNNLIAGTYNLLVEDNNDCTDSELIIISEPSAMTGSYFSSNPSCIGNNDGYIGLIVSGGTEPYLYGWNENYMDIPTISGLTQGTYEVIIMDANNCVLNLGATLLEDEDVDCLRIPNAFTPNGDDTNDTWIIENLEIFPGAYVHVFN